MTHKITSRFDFGDRVFIVGHDDPEGGIVIGYFLEPGFRLKVRVRWDSIMENDHWEFELTAKEPFEEMNIDPEEL
jgi:hypothetical protein